MPGCRWRWAGTFPPATAASWTAWPLPLALVLEPGAYPSALVLANFKDKDVDTLLDLMKQAQVNIPLKAVVTPANRSWVFGDLLAHLQEEHTAFTAAKENQTR